MNVHHVLLVCFISALCGGNSGLVRAQLSTYTGAVGGTGSILCYLSISGSTKFFCKEECQGEDAILVTDGVAAKSGRYSLTYRNASTKTGILSVNFVNLSQSDTGRYRCGLGKTFAAPDSYVNFEIRVSNAPLGLNSTFVRTNMEGENATYECRTVFTTGAYFFCKDQCRSREDVLINTTSVKAQDGRYAIEYIRGSMFGLYITITQVNESDTGWYRCGSGDPLSPASNFLFPVLVNAPRALTSSLARTNAEGENVTYECGTAVSKGMFFFCKDQCARREDVLINTTSFKARVGRYGIEYVGGSTNVTIMQVNKSDTGWYRCGSGNPSSPASYVSFPVLIVDASSQLHVSRPGYFLPVVVCVPLVGVLLLVVFLLLLYKQKTRRNRGGDSKRTDDIDTRMSAIYENSWFNPAAP